MRPEAGVFAKINTKFRALYNFCCLIFAPSYRLSQIGGDVVIAHFDWIISNYHDKGKSD